MHATQVLSRLAIFLAGGPYLCQPVTGGRAVLHVIVQVAVAFDLAYQLPPLASCELALLKTI